MLFLPCTPNSELMKRVRNTDREFRRGTGIKRVKFVERAGSTIADLLVSGNPWGDQKCGRKDCFICVSEKESMKHCMKENALYKIQCIECKSKKVISEYWGETGRNCYLRGGEHIKGLRNRDEDSALWKHTWERHEGVGNERMYEMKLEKSFRKPLERQIREGVEIEMSKADYIMNSKAAWMVAGSPGY